MYGGSKSTGNPADTIVTRRLRPKLGELLYDIRTDTNVTVVAGAQTGGTVSVEFWDGTVTAVPVTDLRRPW